MRDVIVIGAGGGGPVVAKELAARGLSVLLLEAGPRHADPRGEWTHFENDANNPLTGFLRFGPADRTRPAWFRELPQNSFLFQVAGVGGTTQHYFGNCPRAYPGVFAGYDGPDAAAYDTAHRFPFRYADLVPGIASCRIGEVRSGAARLIPDTRYEQFYAACGVARSSSMTSAGVR